MKNVFKLFLLIYLLCFVIQFTNAQVYQTWEQTFAAQYGSYGKASGISVDISGNIYITGYSNFSGLSNDYDYVTIKYNSQGIQKWISTFSGTANMWDEAVAIVIDGSKNIYVTGFTGGVSTVDDYATIKYDSNGVQKWIAKYEKPNSHDVPTAIAVDSSGNVYVTGSTGSTSGDYCTIKYDSSGIQKWIAEYSGSANDWDIPSSIAVDQSGNIYVTGFIREGIPIRENYCTIKYNPNGTQLWIRKYNGQTNETDISNALALDNKGNVFVTGKSWISINVSFNYATIKYDSAGTEKWNVMYDSPQHGTDEALSIICDTDGSVIVTGVSQDDYLTVKYDSNGVQKWTARYNGTGNYIDQPASVKLDMNHNVYVTGVSRGTWDDYATLKYNSGGLQQWVMRYNGINNLNDNAVDLAVDGSNVIITGWSTVNTYTNNFVTIKYSQPIGIQTITENVPDEFSLNQNYPNPFNPSTKIKFDVAEEMKNSGGNVNLTVYNVLGEKIAVLANEDLKPGSYEVDWDASNYSGGIYFARLTAGEYRETIKMVLVK